jgi:hypothetical protein
VVSSTIAPYARSLHQIACSIVRKRLFSLCRTRPKAGDTVDPSGQVQVDDLLAQGQRQGARTVALVAALVVARLLDPASKLTTARLLNATTATSSLGTVPALGKVDEQELYDALVWLLAQQERIEAALARRHLSHGTLVLYDVSSTYFEGRTCELAKFGHNRDGKSGKLQIVFGLLCAKDGCPVAIEVFDGNVADSRTDGHSKGRCNE